MLFRVNLGLSSIPPAVRCMSRDKRRVLNRRMDEGKPGEHLSLQRNTVYAHTGSCHGRGREPSNKDYHGKMRVHSFDGKGRPKSEVIRRYCPCCQWPPLGCPECMKQLKSAGHMEPEHPDDALWKLPEKACVLCRIVTASDAGPSAKGTTSGSASSVAIAPDPMHCYYPSFPLMFEMFPEVIPLSSTYPYPYDSPVWDMSSLN